MFTQMHLDDRISELGVPGKSPIIIPVPNSEFIGNNIESFSLC